MLPVGLKIIALLAHFWKYLVKEGFLTYKAV